MLNFNRRDRTADPAEVAKSVLKPAIYDPPAGAQPAGATSARTAVPQAAHAEAASAPRAGAAATTAATTSAASAKPHGPDAPESKLFVGVNIKLTGVSISDCDAVVIEGHVEATVRSKAMEIAAPGTLKGIALIDVAEIHGEFSGELTVRTRLVVHGTGRVSGTIRYGKLIVAEGGEVTGDVKRLEPGEELTLPTADSAVPATPANLATATRPALSPSSERWSN